VVLDGEAMLCEVKSSWRSLRPSHIKDFVALAIRLRPNIALLAVMDVGSGPESEMATARAQLAVEGIEFELLTLEVKTWKMVPYLYGDDEA
jgi:hypothetical protein